MACLFFLGTDRLLIYEHIVCSHIDFFFDHHITRIRYQHNRLGKVLPSKSLSFSLVSIISPLRFEN